MSQAQPATPQAALNPRYARLHGCAWFDVEPGGDLTKAGIWASVGGEPARRVHGIQSLDRHVLWWTNLTRPQVWKMGRLERIKDENFLGPAWGTLLAEHSQDGDAQSVALWSETMARLAEWLSEWVHQHEPTQPWEWGEGILAETLAERWGWATSPEQAPQPQPILNAAYLESVEYLPPGGIQQWAGRRYVTLSLPRVTHVGQMWLERSPAPGEHFKRVPDALLPRGIDAGLRWLQAQRQPLLVRIDHVDFMAGMTELGRVWMGQRGRRFPAALMEPVWMTSEEALSLSEFARFEIESVYEGQHWHQETGPQVWTEEALKSPLGVHSTMLGLLGHAAWQASASPTRSSHGRQRWAVTPRAVWQRAADRRACFEAARHLVDRGIPVAGYGQGQVVIAMDPAMDPVALAKTVRSAGLVLPRMLAQVLPLSSDASSENPLDVAHWLARVGDVQIPWDLDRLVSPWLGSASEVRNLLRDAANRLDALDMRETPNWVDWWRPALRAQVALTSERLQASVRRRGRG